MLTTLGTNGKSIHGQEGEGRDSYRDASLEFIKVIEDQRQAARTAAEFERAGCPLLAESYHIEARRLADRMWELHDQVKVLEAEMRAGRA